MYLPSVIKYCPACVTKHVPAEPVNPQMYRIFVKFVISKPSRLCSDRTFFKFSCLLKYISSVMTFHSLFLMFLLMLLQNPSQVLSCLDLHPFAPKGQGPQGLDKKELGSSIHSLR